jgi:hypothetical protein
MYAITYTHYKLAILALSPKELLTTTHAVRKRLNLTKPVAIIL